MSTPHKHAAILHAVADGKAVHWGFMSQDRWFSENFQLSMLQDEGYKFRVAPHRWQAEIDAQAAGKVIQIRGDGPWFDDSVPNFGNTSVEFRIKPEAIRYRVALHKIDGRTYTVTADNEVQESRAADRSSFQCWIGDWQEVEA